MIPLIVAVMSSVTSVLTSLGMLVMLMAGMANAKPHHLQQGKWMMWGIVAVQLLSLVAAVWLMARHKHWPASLVGIVPFVAVVVLIVVLVKIEW